MSRDPLDHPVHPQPMTRSYSRGATSKANDVVFLKRLDVPNYLRKSSFFKGLDKNDNSQFSVPRGCIKPDALVSSLGDAVWLMKTIQFWGVFGLPVPLTRFLIKSTELDKIFSHFDNPEFSVWKRILSAKMEHRMHLAVQLGNANMLSALVQIGYPFPANILYILAKHVKSECFKSLLKHASDNNVIYEHACTYAAMFGHVDMLQFAHIQGCKWDRETTAAASRGGYLDCIRYLHENGCPWDAEVCDNAAERGYLELLIYAHENGCPASDMVCALAAQGGHLDCLKYALDNGCEWSGLECERAAALGHLEMLIFVHENGSPWDENTCAAAACGGHLNCLRYAHENDCEWSEAVCQSAAAGGHLEILKYAHEHGCPWDCAVYDAAAYTGDMIIMEYAFQNGCPISNNDPLRQAAGTGKLALVKYCVETMNLCLDKVVMNNACEFGNNVEVVRYLQEADCPVGWRAIELACKCGNVEIVKYLYSLYTYPFNRQNCFTCCRGYYGEVLLSHMEVAAFLTKAEEY